jgi:SnoaL-like domain
VEPQNSFSTGYRAFKAIWDGENGDKLRELFSDRFEFHNLDGRNDVTDLKGLRQRMAELRAAHPGARLRVENAIGSGSHIAFDWTLGDAGADGARQQHRVSRLNIPDGSCMLRLNGDHVVELWELNGALAS